MMERLATAAPEDPWLLGRPAARSPTEDARLHQRFFALRHGESEANVAGIVLSDPSVGMLRYGLTEAGRVAVASSADAFAARWGAELTSKAMVHIVASDFKRTAETAEVFRSALEARFLGCCAAVVHAVELRERYFGPELEGGPNTRYDDVWSADREDATSEPLGAESAEAVSRRTWRLVARLDAELTARSAPEADAPESDKKFVVEAAEAAGKNFVVLVSHGDALQILQTAFQGVPTSEHRGLEHLNPAELRQLVQATPA